MTLSANATRKLDEMARMLPKDTHQTPQDYAKPVRVFIELYRAGGSDRDSLHPDLVRDWALEQGWKKQDARDLGEMADIVRITMRELGY